MHVGRSRLVEDGRTDGRTLQFTSHRLASDADFAGVRPIYADENDTIGRHKLQPTAWLLPAIAAYRTWAALNAAG